MKLKDIKKKYYNDSYKEMADAGGINVETLRVFVCADREADVLENGDFILKSKQTKIFKRPHYG